MKKVNIPCQFSGQEQKVDFYIGRPKVENHPIQSQAHWLSSQRGGVVSAMVMKSFQRIHELSLKNNVPFEELCEYTINLANVDSEVAENQYDELLENKDEIIAREQEKLNAAQQKHKSEE
ncbi:MAG: DUF2610 domain-containing protein [Rickettsiales bacterium]